MAMALAVIVFVTGGDDNNDGKSRVSTGVQLPPAIAAVLVTAFQQLPTSGGRAGIVKLVFAVAVRVEVPAASEGHVTSTQLPV